MSANTDAMDEFEELMVQTLSIDSVPNEHIRTVLALILDHLNLDIVREKTPDYTAYELRSR